MALMFVALDDLRAFQKKCREEFGLDNSTFTDVDMYMAKMFNNVTYPNCERCHTPIKRLNENVVPIFSIIPVIKVGDTVDLRLQRFFLNKMTERFCDVEVNDVVTCACGANDVTERANQEMMRIAKELTEDEMKRMRGKKDEGN